MRLEFLKFPAFALSCACLLPISPAVLAGDTLTVEGLKAATAVDFSIIIPVVLRILENRHPLSLPITPTRASSISATQRMVLISTLGRGFCVDLQLSKLHISGWKVAVTGSAGTWVQPSSDGYRVCARQAGRYELALQHEFRLKPGDQDPGNSELQWPVSLSLATP
jgi:hypothetical protein